MSEQPQHPASADLRRKAEKRLEALLFEGMEGKETPVSRADWQALRREALAQASAGKRLR